MSGSMTIPFIPVQQIAAPSYVRTQNGHDKESLTQLAENIKAQGLLQPIVVRPIPDDERDSIEQQEGILTPKYRYAVIAGRRRLAAVKLAGLEEIPAIVRDTDEARSYEMEIAENIQREQMTLADTARAVRTLMTIYNNQKTVCTILNKSQAWVSKHLAVTSSKCPAPIMDLMDRGIVGDLETLILLKQIAEMPTAHPDAAATLTRMLRIANAGNMNRQLARDALAKLRAPKAPPAPSPAVTRQTTTRVVTPEGTHTGTEVTADPKTEFTVILPIDCLELLERAGGAEWLAGYLRGTYGDANA